MIFRYPLAWPPGWPRTEWPNPTEFTVTEEQALVQIENVIERLGGQDAIFTSGRQLRNDGKWSRNREPVDRGVALYFTRDGHDICIPCDSFDTIRGNVRAIGLTLQAIHSMERYGTSQMVEAAFRGFEALPEGKDKNDPIYMPAQPWYDVLEVSQNASPEVIRAAYRAKAAKAHPDTGGDAAAFDRIQKAYDEGIS